MKRNLFILLALILSGVAYTWYDGNSARKNTAEPAASAEPDAKTDMSAPDFVFKTMDGKTYKLSTFKGRPVVLNFWATWCPPCVIEFPQMLRLAQKTDAVFIFLSQDDDDQAIERFLKKYGKELPIENVYVARDIDKKIAQKSYQTFKLPETYLIDANHMIEEKIIGADVEWDDEKMVMRLRDLE